MNTYGDHTHAGSVWGMGFIYFRCHTDDVCTLLNSFGGYRIAVKIVTKVQLE